MTDTAQPATEAGRRLWATLTDFETDYPVRRVTIKDILAIEAEAAPSEREWALIHAFVVLVDGLEHSIAPGTYKASISAEMLRDQFFPLRREALGIIAALLPDAAPGTGKP